MYNVSATELIKKMGFLTYGNNDSKTLELHFLLLFGRAPC